MTEVVLAASSAMWRESLPWTASVPHTNHFLVRSTSDELQEVWAVLTAGDERRRVGEVVKVGRDRLKGGRAVRVERDSVGRVHDGGLAPGAV